MLNYNGDVNHSQQFHNRLRHGAVVMFLTTHSVFANGVREAE
jgi:hypothetical protein